MPCVGQMTYAKCNYMSTSDRGILFSSPTAEHEVVHLSITAFYLLCFVNGGMGFDQIMCGNNL